MELFELIPENSESRLRDRVETEISKWLVDTGFDADAKIIRRLSDVGIRGQSAWMCLAQIKSLYKYKYRLKPESLRHILDYAQHQPVLQKLIKERPYLLAKTGMIYEHAPTFLQGRHVSEADVDACLLEFAINYTSKFWEYSASPQGTPLTHPRRVLNATFWDSEFWHPAAYLQKACEENRVGVEYYVDFHPFNLNKLLPEDFSVAHRDLIREWIEHMNLRLSIHSAIVGPYSEPDYMGKQLYSDPVDAVDLQKETVLLARDIGASSVVLHLVNPNRLSELAEIIETAADSDIRVTLENYYYTEKIKQTSEAFIAVLESLAPALTKRTREKNFGVTFDPGHYNIEGNDPIVAALHVGKWCKDEGIHLTKIHATTNYGNLRCFPPNFSSDVHDRVSNLGIDNRLIIQMIRALGHSPLVTAEQIKPLSEKDIELIDSAQRDMPDEDYRTIVQKGRESLIGQSDDLITPADTQVEAYQFIAGLAGVSGLGQYLAYRKIQNTEYMTSETARVATIALTKAPLKTKQRVIARLGQMLQSAIHAEGGVSQSSIDAICERLNAVLFAEIHREYLDAVFAKNVTYQAGETICQEGSIGTEMFYIKRGQVQVFIAGRYIATLDAGEIFGEMSLFYGMPRSATVKSAMDNTEIGILNKKALLTSLEGRKDSAKAILLQLYRLLPDRLRNLNAKYARTLKLLQTLNPSFSRRLTEEHVNEASAFDDSFEMMTPKELETLFDEDRFYASGEVVFDENMRADGAYLIKSGWVWVIRYDLHFQDSGSFGRMAQEELAKIFDKDQFYVPEELVSHEGVQLARLGHGNIVGEVALVDDSDRSATIVSDGATLGYLPKAEFDRIMETHVDLSHKLLLNLCSTMMSRISRLNGAYLQVASEIRRHSG